jgi:hypothetical protein
MGDGSVKIAVNEQDVKAEQILGRKAKSSIVSVDKVSETSTSVVLHLQNTLRINDLRAIVHAYLYSHNVKNNLCISYITSKVNH